MAILKVAQIGNPILRRPARPVDEQMLADGALARLLGDLVETMREYRGVGLAAPQVREPLRAFVMEVRASERHPDRPAVALQKVLNPRIVALTDELDDAWEGCLSIAGLRGQVPRYASVRLEGLAPSGDPLALELEGFAARVAQHEADHLDGVVYLDRMRDMRTLTAEEEYQRETLIGQAPTGDGRP